MQAAGTYPITDGLNKGLQKISNNKELKALLWIAGVAITVFTAVSLYNQSRMHKILYLKAQLDIEKLKSEGITLPPTAR